MFSEVELHRFVAVLTANLDRDRNVSWRLIITQLLEDLLSEKASKDHGYFLAVTGLKRIGKGIVVDDSGFVFFPVVFNCRTFLPVKGEILEGVAHQITRLGVIIRCGPAKYAFLSDQLMPNYQFLVGDHPIFLNDKFVKIEKGVVVRFMVRGVRWIEKREQIQKEFAMLASIEGESLGPVPPGELDL